MFDPIKGPPHSYLAPATGDSTEHGDNWFTAVRKINDGFKNIIARLENGVSEIVGGKDPDARDRVSELEDHVRALDDRIALLEGKLDSLDDFLTPTPGQLTEEQAEEIKAAGPGPEVLVEQPQIAPKPAPVKVEEQPAPEKASPQAARSPEFGGSAA